MSLPIKRGTGQLPRYGGGWMHQFSHVYHLQQELLAKPTLSSSSATAVASTCGGDWFRAMELWHTARHEGLALNIAHYTNILSHLAMHNHHDHNAEEKEVVVVGDGPWAAALQVLGQMRREALRADCQAVSLALCVLAKDQRWQEALATFSFFSNHNNADNNKDNKFYGTGLRMNSLCVSAVLQACISAGKQDAALELVAALRSTTKTTKAKTTTAAAAKEEGPHVVPSVDSATLDAALSELESIAHEERREKMHSLSGSSPSSVPLQLDAGGEETETGAAGEEEEEFVRVATKPAAQSRQRRVEEWNDFFKRL